MTGVQTCALPISVLALVVTSLSWTGPAAKRDLAADYAKHVKPLVTKYCLECHSTKVHKGDLDLERFATLELIRKDLLPWQHVIEQLEVGEMPPKGKPQPSGE